MATISSLKDDTLPSYNSGVASVQKKLALTNGIAAAADAIEVFEVPLGDKMRLNSAVLRTSATLGTGATLQARVNRGGVFTTITAATAAGAASKVDSSAQAGVPFDLEGGDVIELLVGGANITAAATATVDLFVSDRL